MPPKKVEPVSPLLADIPYVYLLDQSQWPDFKRALNNCGLTWNIPDWMTTIVYKGLDYKTICNKGEDLDKIFLLTSIDVGDKKMEPGGTHTQKLIEMLGFPKNLGEYIQPSIRFCNLGKLEFEPESKLPARQKLWAWILRCLQGPKQTEGPLFGVGNNLLIVVKTCAAYSLFYST